MTPQNNEQWWVTWPGYKGPETRRVLVHGKPRDDGFIRVRLFVGGSFSRRPYYLHPNAFKEKLR